MRYNLLTAILLWVLVVVCIALVAFVLTGWMDYLIGAVGVGIYFLKQYLNKKYEVA